MVTFIKTPQLDVNDKFVNVFFSCDEGTYVKENDIIITVESAKASTDLLSEVDGYIHFLCADGEEVEIGREIAFVANTEKEYQEKLNEIKEIESNAIKDFDKAKVMATEKAIKKAKELGIDLSDISKQGYIKEDDVIKQYNKASSKEYKVQKSVFNYDRERVIIIGAGMGADVVIDILQDDYGKTIVGLVDDYYAMYERHDYKVLEIKINDFIRSYDRNAFDTVVISISSDYKLMRLRKEIYQKAIKEGLAFTNVISKSAEIRRDVILGKGNVIGSGVYIGTNTIIGDNNYISYRATIGHHNSIGDHNLLAPNVITSGLVEIGNSNIVPTNVSFKNRITIGDNIIFPLGYTVVNNIQSGTIIKEILK